MDKNLVSIYFDEELPGGRIYDLLDLLEQRQLVDPLVYDIVGPIQQFEKTGQVRFEKVRDRAEWIRNKLAAGDRISFYTSPQAELPIPYFSTQYSGMDKSKKRKLECAKFVLKDGFSLDSLYSALNEIAAKERVIWGDCTPWSTVGHIVKQIVRPHEKDRIPPFGLPIIKVPQLLSGPEIPFFFGWINYWCPETVAAVDFDFARDEHHFYKIEKTNNGGVILQLTERPLDLENPDHLKVLLETYERFPKVGGRETG